MKFRHLEKVKVKRDYYRNYTGIITGATKQPGKNNMPEEIVYDVKLTIKKDPAEYKVEKFKEEELTRSWF